MSKHVVFISLPMSGIPEGQVKKSIMNARKIYLLVTGRTIEEVMFVDTMDNPDPPEYLEGERHGVWYLGNSLMKLSKCDEAFFYLGWFDARGCRIERHVCDLYGIPYIAPPEWLKRLSIDIDLLDDGIVSEYRKIL